jgi:DNA-binding CsgD family transcriptional regulator
VFFFVLALYLIASSLGMGVLILTLLTYSKVRQKKFLDVAFTLIAATLLIVVHAVRTYARTPSGSLDPSVPMLSLILTPLGYGLLAYAFPLFAYRLVDVPVSRSRLLIHGAFIVLFVAFGVLKETFAGVFFGVFDIVTFSLVNVYAAAVVLLSFRRISDQALRSVVQAFLVLLTVMLVLGFVQVPLLNRFPLSPRWREVPFVQLLYQISASCLILFFAVRYVYKPDIGDSCNVPVEFVNRFRISERECEIISLVMQGFSHKQIGDKLFISSRTVKNHIYNIYQKTGAENKVQLLNMIRTNHL